MVPVKLFGASNRIALTYVGRRAGRRSIGGDAIIDDRIAFSRYFAALTGSAK